MLKPTNHSSCQYCSVDARAVRWGRIGRSEPKPLKNKCYRRMLGVSYHSANTRWRNTYGMTAGEWPCQTQWGSTVASYRGSAMPNDIIRCRKPYYMEQWKVVVAEEDSVSQRVEITVTVVVAAHRGRQGPMDNHHNRAVCWSAPATSARHGNLASCKLTSKQKPHKSRGTDRSNPFKTVKLGVGEYCVWCCWHTPAASRSLALMHIPQ